MYKLWKDKYITLPSEFWNASEGDKIVLKAFYDYNIERKNEKIIEMINNKTPILPVIVV